MDFNILADSVIKGVGGEANIASLTHCATRLRFTLKNEEAADETAVKAIKGVLGVARSGGQFQVIIGNEVPKAYAAIQERLPVTGPSVQKTEESAAKVKFSEKLFDFIASIFTPVLPAIIGAGLVKSVLALAVLCGMDASSNTYYFINIIGDAPLYFLPMLLAVTASKKLNCNTYMAVAITGALLHPNYAALITDAFNLNFSSVFGILVTLASYNSSVIPVILMVFLLKYVDQFLDRIIPKMIKFFFKPLLTLLVVASLTFIVLGPVGFVAGVAISTGLNTLSNHVGWLVPMIVGGIFPLMVTTGMHYGIVPFMLQSIAAQGFEQICCPGNLPSNIAQGAASLAVACRTRKSELRQTAFTSGITAVLGVTEPALFGVTLKFKKVLACVMIGGACGGLYSGLTGVKCYSFCSPGLLSMVAFVGPDGWGNLMNSCIALAIGFLVTFALVYFWGYKDEAEEGSVEADVDVAEALAAADRVKMPFSETIVSPVAGECIPLSEVPDATFAEGILGKGIAVKPEDNCFFAPADGVISSIFPTNHAIGMTTDDGVQILIHIGMDTVKLNGEGFKMFAKEGQNVKRGDLLVKCDLDFVKSKGYETVTPVIVANTMEYTDVVPVKTGKVRAGDSVMKVRR